MQAKIPQAAVAQAGVQSIAVGQLGIGPITVGQLSLDNASLSLSAIQASLQNVSVNVALHITFDWHIHIGLPDGIPDIDIGDSYDLGTLSFGLTIGNILIPGLSNLHFQVPSLTATNVTVTASPLSLQLGGLQADQIAVTDVALPSAGFSLSGMTVTSLSGNGIGLPAASIGHVTVGRVQGDPIVIPALSLPGISLPTIQIPSLSSSTPLSIPAVLPTDSVGFDAGILRAAIHVTPTVTMHVDHLQVSGASASATTGTVVLHNVTLPYNALNLTLSQIGLQTVTIPSFTVA